MEFSENRGIGTKVTVRLQVTNEVANNWKSGDGSNLQATAKEHAERAAKVRFMTQSQVHVELLDAQEVWIVESGQSKIWIDFVYEVMVR
ncbi:MAG: hypothetical protein JO316_15360 [Abitibacteriaceae bacterium]|nr:hypothetical protein [Abditibacteriaceae bacterium]